MKPLTIEELKALNVGDWVWIEFRIECMKKERKCYVQIPNDNEAIMEWNFTPLKYSDYGNTWIAYKNKEIAECKGELVEFPRVRLLAEEGDDKLFDIEWIGKDDGEIRSCWCFSEKQVRKKLEELQEKEENISTPTTDKIPSWICEVCGAPVPSGFYRCEECEESEETKKKLRLKGINQC